MSASVETIQNILTPKPTYTPNDDPIYVYRNISIQNTKYKSYTIGKNINGKRETFGTFQNLVDAVNERDHAEKYDYDLELMCEYPISDPNFKLEDLPPFPEHRGNIYYRTPRYFGFPKTCYARTLVEKRGINPWTRVWKSQLTYNNHINGLGYFNDPLSASLVYDLVKTEVLASDL